MRLVIVEDQPGEVERLGPAETSARLSKAFAAARRGVAKATGLKYGQVKALGELETLMMRQQKRRSQQLAKAVAKAVKDPDA
jgi:hypothetical protein